MVESVATNEIMGKGREREGQGGGGRGRGGNKRKSRGSEERSGKRSQKERGREGAGERERGRGGDKGGTGKFCLEKGKKFFSRTTLGLPTTMING